MIRMLRDAGFDRAVSVPTDGKPGVFATLDAGAPKTVGVYLMYDVKQADPAEWSSPPFDAALVDKPGFGKCVVGRGAVNQKGPESAFLAALHAYRGAGRKLPVNLVLVAEGEEEIGSPHFAQIVRSDEVAKALSRCTGVFMPSAEQESDGVVTVSLGAKGVIELELTSTGEAWGRGPSKDVHSANRARLDSPSFHLVQALSTLIAADGNTPAIEGLDRQGAADLRGGEGDDRAGREEDGRGDDEEADGRDALGIRRRLGRIAREPRLAADRQHRGAGRRLHGAGRQDGPPAQGGREARPEARARHEGGGGSRGASRRTSRRRASATST